MTELDQARRVHFIGIGGCSMNGLAQILHKRGYTVTGSDRERTPFMDALERADIPFSIGHTGEYLQQAELVVYSAAIKPDNPERVLAKERGIPELERSVALGQISAHFERVVAIAGCHGKTTIASMLAVANELSDIDATVHVGGYVDRLGGGVRVGGSDLFITEACEYVESFLTLHPTIALINNIDDDHLDYYRDMDHIVLAYQKFLMRLPEGGTFLACADDERVLALCDERKHKIITYGSSSGADFSPSDINFDDQGAASFTIRFRGKERGRVKLNVPGMHNVVNALGCAAVCYELGIPFEAYAEAMRVFQNTKRRFEFYGERNGVRVFHDYGHHPSEIRATLDAASRVTHGKLFCVFQCNSYTRARSLFCGQVNCFAEADTVLVPDIYPGREKDDGSVHARDMVAAINRATNNAVYVGTFEAARGYLDEHAAPGDLVVTVGSGDVYRQTQILL
jgi:UDP-N-acetylmuramate--alanine ligase